MEIQDIQDSGEVYYVVVDGRAYELSEYQGQDGLACLKCGQSEEWQTSAAGEEECVRGLYTSLDDMYLCSDCLEAADKHLNRH